MKLPNLLKQKFSSTRGQMLIVFLLLLVVASAIVLSIAARTITDVRITTTTDQSNKAYFAAEAGIEEALKKIDDGSVTLNTPQPLNFSNIGTTGETTISLSNTGTEFVYPQNVSQDQVVQVLLAPYDSITTGDVGLWNGLKVYWGTPSESVKTAVEVTLVYSCGGVCPGYTGNFGNNKYAYDPDSGRTSNGFCRGSSIQSSTTSLGGKSFAYNVDITAAIAAPCGNTDNLPAGATPAFLRIRPLYNTSAVPIAVKTAGGSLPSQGYLITARGTNPGSTRTLETIRLFGSMPSLFDYALFNGSGTNPIQK